MKRLVCLPWLKQQHASIVMQQTRFFCGPFSVGVSFVWYDTQRADNCILATARRGRGYHSSCLLMICDTTHMCGARFMWCVQGQGGGRECHFIRNNMTFLMP